MQEITKLSSLRSLDLALIQCEGHPSDTWQAKQHDFVDGAAVEALQVLPDLTWLDLSGASDIWLPDLPNLKVRAFLCKKPTGP